MINRKLSVVLLLGLNVISCVHGARELNQPDEERNRRFIPQTAQQIRQAQEARRQQAQEAQETQRRLRVEAAREARAAQEQAEPNQDRIRIQELDEELQYQRAVNARRGRAELEHRLQQNPGARSLQKNLFG